MYVYGTREIAYMSEDRITMIELSGVLGQPQAQRTPTAGIEQEIVLNPVMPRVEAEDKHRRLWEFV